MKNISLKAIESKELSKSMAIEYGFHVSCFGECFIALVKNGICYLSFVGPLSQSSILQDLHKRWPNATIKQDQTKTKSYIQRIFADSKRSAFKIYCSGTDFQLKVWKTLLQIPKGKTTSYGSIALMIGNRKAVRAVGTAIGKNPVCYLIPCHRVIRENGDLGGYSCGIKRKKEILAQELFNSKC